MLLYDYVSSLPRAPIRTAECFTIASGKIHEIKLVFDASTVRKIMER